MTTLLMTGILVATIVFALALGIASGYSVIHGIFFMLQRNRTERNTAPALVPSAHNGD